MAQLDSPPVANSEIGPLLSIVDELRRLAQDRVGEAKAIMEREVMAAASNVGEIFSSATGHISSLRELVQGFSAGDTAGPSVAGQIDRQLEAVHGFLRGLGGHLAKQKEFVARAVTQAEAIAAAGRKAELLTGRARLLALNARVEAARATDGQCFSVLADEMKQLSNLIGETNVMIQSLALEMKSVLPQIALTVDETQAQADTFNSSFREGSAALNGAVQTQRRQVETALRDSDATLTTIVAGSQAALSHLQFQDVVAQGLDRLDGRFRHGQLALRQLLGVEGAPGDIAPAVHDEIGGDKHIAHADAGQVLLF